MGGRGVGVGGVCSRLGHDSDPRRRDGIRLCYEDGEGGDVGDMKVKRDGCEAKYEVRNIRFG